MQHLQIDLAIFNSPSLLVPLYRRKEVASRAIQ
jgi:hypothetical protein